MEQKQHTLDWVDGERGRALRRLWDPTDYGETIAADLMAVVSATHAFMRGRGLQMTGGGNALFQALVDFIIARLEAPYAVLSWSGRGAKPRGWTDDDERIWIEWLDTTVLTPENWQRHVMEPVFGRRECRIWEEPVNRWRDEWRSYSVYFVTRSRDILQEIDPRPWEESDGGSAPVVGEEEWRR
jgi:hypothetical protein